MHIVCLAIFLVLIHGFTIRNKVTHCKPLCTLRISLIRQKIINKNFQKYIIQANECVW